MFYLILFLRTLAISGYMIAGLLIGEHEYFFTVLALVFALCATTGERTLEQYEAEGWK